jgi:hypothetical protein
VDRGTRPARLAVGALVVVHGAIHLLGAVAGLRWADVDALTVSPGPGWLWLAVSALLFAAGATLLAGGPRWWPLVGAAAAASLVLTATHLPEAASGLVADVLLLLVALYGWWRTSPHPLRGRTAPGWFSGVRPTGRLTVCPGQARGAAPALTHPSRRRRAANPGVVESCPEADTVDLRAHALLRPQRLVQLTQGRTSDA